MGFLKDITPIFFPYLKDLRISFSKVNNIEPIAWLDCPHLEKITIIYSMISNNLKSLAKTNFKELNFLEIKPQFKSTIIELGFVSRVKMNKKSSIFIVAVGNLKFQNQVQISKRDMMLFKCEVDNRCFFHEDKEKSLNYEK
jgi:hypothetical protein